MGGDVVSGTSEPHQCGWKLGRNPLGGGTKVGLRAGMPGLRVAQRGRRSYAIGNLKSKI